MTMLKKVHSIDGELHQENEMFEKVETKDFQCSFLILLEWITKDDEEKMISQKKLLIEKYDECDIVFKGYPHEHLLEWCQKNLP